MAQDTPNHVAIFVTTSSDLSESSLGKSLGKYALLDLPPLIYHSPRGSEQPPGQGLLLRPALGPCRTLIEYSYGGRAIKPEPNARWHHAAFASEELETDAQGLERWGYVREMWAEGPDGAVATFVYMRSPTGLRLELNDPADSMHDKYILNQMEAAVARVAADPAGGAGTLARELKVHHVGATLDDPETELRALNDVLGIDCVKVEVEVTADGRAKGQIVQMWASTGETCLVFAQRNSVPEAMLPDAAGWSHVGFSSADTEADVADLTSIGFRQLGKWAGGPRGMTDGALLAAPEGTHILVVTP